MNTYDPADEARDEQLREMRRLRDAFVAVFGPPGQRTPYGDIVLKHLDKFCGRAKLQVAVDNHNQTDIFRTARMVGRRDVIDAIHNAIEWKENSDVNRS
jgi:hypothetical protein